MPLAGSEVVFLTTIGKPFADQNILNRYFKLPPQPWTSSRAFYLVVTPPILRALVCRVTQAPSIMLGNSSSIGRVGVAQRIPCVVDGVLHVPEPSGKPDIAIGSSSWAAWVRDPATRSFSFRGPYGAFTARKECRVHGGAYWTAYRRRGGRLRKMYLGKAEKLTLEGLNDAAKALARSDDGAVASSVADASAVGDAGRVRTYATAVPGPTAADDRTRVSPRQGARGHPVLLTKLSVPSVRASLVPRPRLGERIEEGMKRKLILVSAPAGFGKTTLLSVWTSELSSGRFVAWFSLDGADNDPSRFWRYFVTAVDQPQRGSGDKAPGVPGAPAAAPLGGGPGTLPYHVPDPEDGAGSGRVRYPLFVVRAFPKDVP